MRCPLPGPETPPLTRLGGRRRPTSGTYGGREGSASSHPPKAMVWATQRDEKPQPAIAEREDRAAGATRPACHMRRGGSLVGAAPTFSLSKRDDDQGTSPVRHRHGSSPERAKPGQQRRQAASPGCRGDAPKDFPRSVAACVKADPEHPRRRAAVGEPDEPPESTDHIPVPAQEQSPCAVLRRRTATVTAGPPSTVHEPRPWTVWGGQLCPQLRIWQAPPCRHR